MRLRFDVPRANDWPILTTAWTTAWTHKAECGLDYYEEKTGGRETISDDLKAAINKFVMTDEYTKELPPAKFKIEHPRALTSKRCSTLSLAEPKPTMRASKCSCRATRIQPQYSGV